MKEDEYPVRYVAFLDILGFSQLISCLRDDPGQVSFVRGLLRNIHHPRLENLQTEFHGSDLRAQSISDAVAISSSPTPAGLAHMFVALEALVIKLLKEGFFVRGAVAKGPLFHDKEMVFGGGLAAAYRYESTVARYPRIMIPREIVADVQTFIQRKEFHQIFDRQVRKSKDGPQYLHVLRRFEEIKKMRGEEPTRQELLNDLAQIRDHIQRRLDEAVDEPAHFEKVYWFADYWTEVFYGVEGLRRIDGIEMLLALD